MIPQVEVNLVFSRCESHTSGELLYHTLSSLYYDQTSHLQTKLSN